MKEIIKYHTKAKRGEIYYMSLKCMFRSTLSVFVKITLDQSDFENFKFRHQFEHARNRNHLHLLMFSSNLVN